MRHLLTVEDFKDINVYDLMKSITKIKKERALNNFKILTGKTIGLIFSKSSTRTRVSFEVGISEMGGFPIYMNKNDLQLGSSETVQDTARTLSRFLHGIVIRTYEQKEVEELAKNGTIPIINALTNEHHPCQTLTDIFTVYERSGKFEGIKMAYIGDGASNMANSLIEAAKYAGMELVISSPKEYAPSEELMKKKFGKGKVEWEIDPIKAVKNTDYIYTDVWVSMGFEAQSKERIAILTPYQVNEKLMSYAPSHVKFMHCLPAHRGLEVTDEVIDGKTSIVFDQAENRLHTQKAILEILFKS